MHTVCISILVTILAATTANCQAPPTAAVSQLHSFPKGYFIENIAVRSNGNLLLSRFGKAEFLELNPFASPPTPKVIQAFSGATGCMGIAEYTPDNFALIVQSRQGAKTNSAIYTIDMKSTSPKATKVADNIFGFLNGLAPISADTVVSTDQNGGDIYRINLKTGVATVISKPGAGANGLRVKGKYMYYANMYTGVFGRIPFDQATGAATGQSESVANVNKGADDFALSPFSDEAYVVNQYQGGVFRVNLNGTGMANADLVAGGPKSGAIASPTSAQFGRTSKDGRTLYVTTGGGKIVAVKL
jgi:hypothetical protein